MNINHEKKIKAANIWIGSFVFMIFIMLFLIYTEETAYSTYKIKIKKEEKKLKKLKLLLQENWNVLFSKYEKKKEKNIKNKQKNISNIVEKVIQKAEVDKWLVRLQPLQSPGSKGGVRLIFRKIPFQGVLNFFYILRQKNLSSLEAKQVNLFFTGKKIDQWRVVITLGWKKR